MIVHIIRPDPSAPKDGNLWLNKFSDSNLFGNHLFISYTGWAMVVDLN
ncbi:490_t:CDS:1, partial [Funneliformis mosseae]